MKLSKIMTEYKEIEDKTPKRFCRCSCQQCGGYHRGSVRVDTESGDNYCGYCNDGHPEGTYFRDEGYQDMIQSHEDCMHCVDCGNCVDEYDDYYYCYDEVYCYGCEDNICYNHMDDQCPACEWCSDCRDYRNRYNHTCEEEEEEEEEEDD